MSQKFVDINGLTHLCSLVKGADAAVQAIADQNTAEIARVLSVSADAPGVPAFEKEALSVTPATASASLGCLSPGASLKLVGSKLYLKAGSTYYPNWADRAWVCGEDNSPVKGRVYLDKDTMKLVQWNGTAFVDAVAGGSQAAPDAGAIVVSNVTSEPIENIGHDPANGFIAGERYFLRSHGKFALVATDGGELDTASNTKLAAGTDKFWNLSTGTWWKVTGRAPSDQNTTDRTAGDLVAEALYRAKVNRSWLGASQPGALTQTQITNAFNKA